MIFWSAIAFKGRFNRDPRKTLHLFLPKNARGTQLAKRVWCLAGHGSEALNGPLVAWATSYTSPYTFSIRSAYVTGQVHQANWFWC